MAVAFSPTGNQTMTEREVSQFLADVRMSPTQKSPRILGINQIPIMRAKSNGYPIDMHHPTMEMRMAMKEEEEMALSSIGYGRQYILKTYPKAMFRRNMAVNFEPKFDIATQLQTNNSFVEERTVRTEQEEKALRLMKPKIGQSLWFDKITDIPEIEEGPAEDPLVTIANLRGALEQANRAQGK